MLLAERKLASGRTPSLREGSQASNRRQYSHVGLARRWRRRAAASCEAQATHGTSTRELATDPGLGSEHGLAGLVDRC